MLGAAIGSLETWQSWLTVLRAAYGLPLPESEQSFFASVSGARKPPQSPVSELWITQAGRRSGKSRIAAALAVYEAVMVPRKLAHGEVGYVLCLSATRSQARTLFNYCCGFLEASPLLAATVMSTTADEIRLSNNVVIATHTNSFRSVSGRTLLTCLFDEIAFWTDEESANPDIEVLRAVTPSLAASGGRLIGISSPYRKAGLLYERHRGYFGTDDDDILVIQGGSRVFNPTLSPKIIERAERDDPESAAAEWNAEFRNDICGFLDHALISRAVDPGRPLELAPQPWPYYHAFIDASGGRRDSYVLAIGHREKPNFVIDCVRSYRPPFNPGNVTSELAYVAKNYGIRRVTGDNYSGEWVKEAWRSEGLGYDTSDMPASELYSELLLFFTREQIKIPNHTQLIKELRLLERRTSRMGRDLISHPLGSHDDHANAVAGCVRQLAINNRVIIEPLHI